MEVTDISIDWTYKWQKRFENIKIWTSNNKHSFYWYSLLSYFSPFERHKEVRIIQDLEYLNTIFFHINTFQCHWSRICETLTFRTNRCKNWKIYILSFPIILLLLRIVNEQVLIYSLPLRAYLPSRMNCNDGRSIQIISFEFIQYFRLLLIRIHRMSNYLM